VRTKGT